MSKASIDTDMRDYNIPLNAFNEKNKENYRINGLKQALEVQFAQLEQARKANSYIRINEAADNIAKLSYTIYFLENNRIE